MLHTRNDTNCTLNLNTCFDKIGDGCYYMGFSPRFDLIDYLTHISTVSHCILSMDAHGLYSNLRDHSVRDFVAMPLLSLCKCQHSNADLLDDTVVTSVHNIKPSLLGGKSKVCVKDNSSVNN